MMIVYMVLSLVVGLGLGYFFKVVLDKRYVKDASSTASRLIEEAKKEASNMIADARLKSKEIMFNAKSQGEMEVKERMREISQAEKRLAQAFVGNR